MKYKLIVSDIDSTLIDRDFRIPDYNTEMIRRAQEAGISFVLCTGRIFGSARPYAKMLDLKTPIITSNGGVTIDVLTGRKLYGHAIQDDVLEWIFHKLDDLALYYHFYGEKTFYVNNYPLSESRIARINKHLKEEDKVRAFIIDDVRWVLHVDPIYKISIRTSQDGEYERFMEAFSDVREITITSSYQGACEINAAGVNKGEALSQYARMMGYQPSEILACGDNHNDLEMIRYAGMGVAVENAVPELREQADYITDTNENAGVGKAIARLVFGEEPDESEW